MDAKEEEEEKEEEVSSSAPEPTPNSVISEAEIKENREGGDEKEGITIQSDVSASISASTVKEDGQQQQQNLVILPRSFPDLPMIVMEYILAHFSYFEVLQFRLVSTFWDDMIRGKEVFCCLKRKC